MAFIPQEPWQSSTLLALFLAPNLISLVSNLWYFWIFFPGLSQHYSKRTLFFAFPVSFFGSLFIFSKVFSASLSPILCLELWTATCLGLYLRHALWEDVDTLVLHLNGFKIYAVPVYVHLFFYLFYLLCSRLTLEGAFSEGPNTYLLPLSCFLISFLTGSFLSRKKKESLDSKRSPVYTKD